MGSEKHAKADPTAEIEPPPADMAEPASDAAHPEEMRATVEIDIAGRVAFRASARATPAGLVSVALLLAAIMVPLAWASRARASTRRR